MQEKDIKRKLNQELDEMAPDILNKILAQPIEPVKSEKELFGKDKPLFKEKKRISPYIFAPALTAIAACFIMVIMLLQPNNTVYTNMAFSLIIDVNPSITIDVDKEGNVERVVAGNDDAKEIVDQINTELKEDDTYESVMNRVIDELKKAGYMKKKNKAMLVTVVSEDEKDGNQKIETVKDNAEKYLQEENVKCKPIYQSCVVTEEIEKVAKKNNISVGKAAFALKIAEKENKDVNEICNETVDYLAQHAEDSGVTVDSVVVYEGVIGDVATRETTTNESETMGEAVTREIETTTTEDKTFVENEETSVQETTTDASIIIPEEAATSNQQLEP